MIVGTAGHVDHGKTALVRALTGVDTDRLKEEKARGITIDLGFAYAPGPDGTVIGFVDVPGHERFVHNMLAGAAGIDLALLVVAADDGIMPQTIEHLAIVDLLGIRHGLVALTKVDLVSSERRAEVGADIHALLAGTALDGSEIIDVSSVTGEGVEALRQKLHASAVSIAGRTQAGRFRLAVDRSFTLTGIGTVVTGTVLSGGVAVNDHVRISPSGKDARVRSIHAQNRAAERGRAGERCALNLVGDGIAKDAIARGNVVLDPALHAPTWRIDVQLEVLSSEPKAVGQWMPVRFHHGASEVGGRIVPLCEGPISPGQCDWAQIVLDAPIAAAAGDRFIIRDTSARRTVGGGRLIDLRAPSRRRRTPERLAQLAALANADPAVALGAYLDGPPGYVDLVAFARDRALGMDETTAIADHIGLVQLAGAGAVHSTFALSAKRWMEIRRSLAAALDAFHKESPDLQGMGRERLRLRLTPRLPEPAFIAALQHLAKLGEVATDGAWVRLPSHHARLTPEHEALWARVRPLLGGVERFRPPRVREIAGTVCVAESDIRRLLKLASRLGRVDEIAHDHFFLRATTAEMVRVAQAVAQSTPTGEFTAAELRDKLNNGRKVAIQVLEFFDRHGVTLRRGDNRRVNIHRVDLFRSSAEQAGASAPGRETSPVGRPDFKSGKGREPALGGFDPHSLPPPVRPAAPRRGLR